MRNDRYAKISLEVEGWIGQLAAMGVHGIDQHLVMGNVHRVAREHGSTSAAVMERLVSHWSRGGVLPAWAVDEHIACEVCKMHADTVREYEALSKTFTLDRFERPVQ